MNAVVDLSRAGQPRPGENYERNEYVAAPLRFAGVFTPEECERIVALGESRPLQEGRIVRPREDYRRTKVAWLPRQPADEWLFAKLDGVVERLNQWYRFDIYPRVDDLQYGIYETGDGFGWHIDCGGERSSTRKISLSIQLTHPAEYDGGGLEFVTHGELPMSRIQGTVIAFPSFVCHRVTPITRGTRRSLVVWVVGPPFR